MRKFLIAMLKLLAFVYTNRRLPGRIANHPISCIPHWLRIRWLWARSRLQPIEGGCVIFFPVLHDSYTYILVNWLLLNYGRVYVVWNPTLNDLAKMYSEGRRVLKCKNVTFLRNLEYSGGHPWNSCDVVGANHTEIGFRQHLEIRPDISEENPPPGSYLLPYTAHPQNLVGSPSVQLRSSPRRHIRVFFAGVSGFYEDHALVRRVYGVPSRDESLSYLQDVIPKLRLIRDLKQRKLMFSDSRVDSSVGLAICTCKGISKNWYSELTSCDFFLCLPGSHMLMCHNSIEAMECGCIPILAYHDWFVPNLENNINCLVYKDLDGMKNAVTLAMKMSESEVAHMRENVLAYYERYVNPTRISQEIKSFLSGQELTSIYMNHEDCRTLAASGCNSVLKAGGSLQRC